MFWFESRWNYKGQSGCEFGVCPAKPTLAFSSILTPTLKLNHLFDFENLEVYKKAKAFNATVCKSLLKVNTLDGVTKNQLRRASLSIVLNIGGGTSRFSKPDRRNFCVIARGSVFECVAIFDILKEDNQLSIDEFNHLYTLSEEISKMLFAMIRNLES